MLRGPPMADAFGIVSWNATVIATIDIPNGGAGVAIQVVPRISIMQTHLAGRCGYLAAPIRCVWWRREGPPALRSVERRLT